MPVYDNLISPLSRKKLFPQKDRLITEDGLESFPLVDGIADLLSADLLDQNSKEEIKSFEENPVFNVCYFRNSLFDFVIGRLKKYTALADRKLRFAEYGGGEGYLARSVASAFCADEVIVCDLSHKYLKLAPPNLERVLCDVRYPCIQGEFLDASAYWVSLHHFSGSDCLKCLQEAYNALVPGGIIILFEPNAAFFPRKVVMQLEFLRNKVYFDEAESHLEISQVLDIARNAGFEELETIFLNPPYALDFASKLKSGYLFFCGTEFLHLMDRIGISALIRKALSLIRRESYWGLYFLTFLRKKSRP